MAMLVKESFKINDGASGLERVTEIIQKLFIDGYGAGLKKFFTNIGATIEGESDYGLMPISSNNLRYCLVFKYGIWYYHYMFYCTGTSNSNAARVTSSSTNTPTNQSYANQNTFMLSTNNMFDVQNNQHTYNANNNYVSQSYVVPVPINNNYITSSMECNCYVVDDEKKSFVIFDTISYNEQSVATTGCWTLSVDKQSMYAGTDDTSQTMIGYFTTKFSTTTGYFKAFDNSKDSLPVGPAITRMEGNLIAPITNYSSEFGTLLCPNFFSNGIQHSNDSIKILCPAFTLGTFKIGGENRYAIFVTAAAGKLSTTVAGTCAIMLTVEQYNKFIEWFGG